MIIKAKKGALLPGAFCDLVWSDPEEIDSWSMSPRGAGWLFGASVTQKFTETNNLRLICRAHQLVNEGKWIMVFGRWCLCLVLSEVNVQPSSPSIQSFQTQGIDVHGLANHVYVSHQCY